MKTKQLWHMYYSGMDVVELEKSWVEEVASKEFCPHCESPLRGEEYCPDVPLLQKIPRNMDMFFMYYGLGIMSGRLREILGDFTHALNFGEIRFVGGKNHEVTHYSFTAKRTILLHGTKPIIWLGKQTSLEEWPSHCPECGKKYDRSRGQRFLYEDEVPETGGLFGTVFDLLFCDDVYEILSQHKFRGVRMDKVLIKPRSFVALS
jgi:predicted amidophosphoribosyltransferase